MIVGECQSEPALDQSEIQSGRVGLELVSPVVLRDFNNNKTPVFGEFIVTPEMARRRLHLACKLI